MNAAWRLLLSLPAWEVAEIPRLAEAEGWRGRLCTARTVLDDRAWPVNYLSAGARP